MKRLPEIKKKKPLTKKKKEFETSPDGTPCLLGSLFVLPRRSKNTRFFACEKKKMPLVMCHGAQLIPQKRSCRNPGNTMAGLRRFKDRYKESAGIARSSQAKKRKKKKEISTLLKQTGKKKAKGGMSMVTTNTDRKDTRHRAGPAGGVEMRKKNKTNEEEELERKKKKQAGNTGM